MKMSSSVTKDDCLSSRSIDETESPRKRMKLDNSARKGWSFMDRRADQEVLQEMGVSVLEPDDAEFLCDTPVSGALHHKPAKKKRDIENVNPNVNTQHKVKSPCKGSPSAGPSRLRSPRSTEKSKPLQPIDQQTLETTLLEHYLSHEETPLGQSVGLGSYIGRGFESRASVNSSGGVSDTDLTRVSEEAVTRFTSEVSEAVSVGEDSFSALSDEMMLSVFRWLPKRTLTRCMTVCKRWHRVACDETLWQRLDLGSKSLAKDALGRILSRKPTVVRLANTEISQWHPSTPPEPSRIQYLDLSMAATDSATLGHLLTACPLLKKLSLESLEIGGDICRIIGKCKNLETLNLAMTQGITADGLSAMLEGCIGLSSLNISWTSLSEEALEILVTKLPTRVQRLNAGGARQMSDDMVSKLVSRCPRLVELDLSDCSRLGSAAISTILTLNRLEHLALSRCYLLPPHALTKLSVMPSLQYVELWGMLQSASLSALRAALPAIHLNQFMFSAIARPTVGTRRTSIWGLRTRD